MATRWPRIRSRACSTRCNDVPGVEISRTGTVGSVSQVRIRGAEAGQALVLIDGVRANDPGQSSEEFNFAHLLTRRRRPHRGAARAAIGAVGRRRAGGRGERGHGGAAAGISCACRRRIRLVRFQRGHGPRQRRHRTCRRGRSMAPGWIRAASTSRGRGTRTTAIATRASAGARAPRSRRTSLSRLRCTTPMRAAKPKRPTFSGTFSIPIDSGDYTKFAATYGRAEAKWTAVATTST